MISRARLRLCPGASGTRIALAAATAPQRWTPGETDDGWLTVRHQVIGDGYHPGDAHVTRIEVAPSAAAAVRSPAATPLRAGGTSLAATSLLVGDGAALIYLPGALIPHARATHDSILHATVHPGGALALAQVLVPGRTAHNSDPFTRLRIRTRISLGTEPTIDELIFLRHADWPPGNPVAVALTVVGRWQPADPSWWGDFLPPSKMAGIAHLRAGGVLVRALLPSLGCANEFVEKVAEAMRKSWSMKICSSSRKGHETRAKEP